MKSIMRTGDAAKLWPWNIQMDPLTPNSLEIVHLGKNFVVISEDDSTQ